MDIGVLHDWISNKASDEGDLAETVKGLAEDKKALATASSSCMTVAADHEATVKSRNEEFCKLHGATIGQKMPFPGKCDINMK